MCFFRLSSRGQMEAKEQDIIEKALRVFMRQGIKSVNMDFIYKAFVLWKTTLFLFFKVIF